MKSIVHVVLVLLVFAAAANECRGQRGIPVPRFSPAPVRVHPIIPPGGHSSGGGTSFDPLPVILGIVALAVTIVAGVFAVRAWRNRTVGYVQIVLTPPGEAPEEIRRAWVGLELPLRRGESQPRSISSVGVLSNQFSQETLGYVVDGRKAVAALACQSPEAAAWWREHAPHVLARGYRLFFPTGVCQGPPAAGV
jgi:hypothetical protein